MKIELEPNQENVERIRYLFKMNQKLDDACHGRHVCETQEEENELIQAGSDYKKLINDFNIEPFMEIL